MLKRFSEYCNLLFVSLFVIELGIFLIGMPKYTDDYWLMQHLRPWFAAQSIDVPENGGDIWHYGIPWSGIIDTWRERWLTDNIRLGNMLAVIFTIFQKWLSSGLIWSTWIWTMFAAMQVNLRMFFDRKTVTKVLSDSIIMQRE